MTELKDFDFIFIGKPVPKPRMTRADAWKKRKAVVDYFLFKDNINIQAKDQEFKISDRHSITFIIEMPKSWSIKKKNAMNGKPHQQRPDLDNMCKSLWDSLLEEDGSVYYVEAEKKWGVGGKILVKNLA